MKLLLTAALTLAASAAFAGKSTTEYLFKPGANAQALRVDYQMITVPDHADPGPGAKVTVADLVFDYSYGLSDSMAVGGWFANGSLKSDASGTTSTASGMGDLHFYLKGHADSIHYAAELGYSLGKAKSDKRNSGGMSLGGDVNWVTSLSGWTVGAGASYDMLMERTEDSNGTDVKTTGGNTLGLKGFGEYNYGQGFFAAELGMNMSGATTVADVDQKNAETVTSLALIGTYDFNDMATGILTYAMAMHPAITDAAQKAYTASVIQLGARFNF